MVLEYFVATMIFEGAKLYLNRNGVWGEFSISETVLAPTIKALNYHYYKWNNCYIKEDSCIVIEKVHMNLSFEEERNEDNGEND